MQRQSCLFRSSKEGGRLKKLHNRANSDLLTPECSIWLAMQVQKSWAARGRSSLPSNCLLKTLLYLWFLTDIHILIQTYFKYWCSFYMWVHQDCYPKSSFFPPPLLSESSRKTAYLNVEIYEENNQCGHVGGLEHEAAKWEPTWLHSRTKCVHNSEQKLDLWRKDHAWVFAEKGSVLAESDITMSPSPHFGSLTTLQDCPFLNLWMYCEAQVKMALWWNKKKT